MAYIIRRNKNDLAPFHKMLPDQVENNFRMEIKYNQVFFQPKNLLEISDEIK